MFEAAGPQLTNIILGAEKALITQLVNAGLPVPSPTEDELAAWRNAATSVAADVAGSLDRGQSVLDAIDAAKAACS